MKTKIILSMLISFVSAEAFSQLDTVVYDAYSVGQKTVNNKPVYDVNGKTVTKAQWDQALKHDNDAWKALGNCKPCWLKDIDTKTLFVTEGEFYMDCCIGVYIEKYPSGKTKVSGQYKKTRYH